MTDNRHNILCAQWVRLMEQLNIGAFTIDRRRKITCFNATAEALTGINAQESIGRDCRQVFSRFPCHLKCPFIADEAHAAENSVIEISDRQNVSRLVTRLAVPLYSNRRVIAGCLTVLQDHSPIVELINRVNYEERTLKIILDNLDIGIFAVNKGGHITFFNSAAELISGYQRREVLGRKFNDIFGGKHVDDFWQLTAAIQDGLNRTGGNIEIISRSEETIPIRSDVMPLRNEQGDIVGGLAMFQDLSVAQHKDKVITDRLAFQRIIGRSPIMRNILAMVNVVAATDATILIEGDTGTGKDLLAKVIHATGKRAEKPFVKVNCASLPDNLLESELFGYVKGAFTGADRNKPGRFEEADGGAILLDEIGDLPLPLQAKLLRVLEDKEFYPLGSRHTLKVDVRIISATNRNLEQMVSQGKFREDLFYRLNVLRIELPPLKKRREDIPFLIRYMLKRLSLAHQGKIAEVSDSALQALLHYDYPGNIRELENILEHAVILSGSGAIEYKHLPLSLQNRIKSPLRAATMLDGDEQSERERIISALRRCGGNRTRAAKALDINRSTLWRKISKWGIHP